MSIRKPPLWACLLLAASLVGTPICVKGIGRLSRQDQLLRAAQNGNEAEVRAALQAGAEPNYEFESDVIPLMLAVSNDHLGAAKALLEAGADPKKEDYSGQSSLDRAQSLEMRALLARYAGGGEVAGMFWLFSLPSSTRATCSF